MAVRASALHLNAVSESSDLHNVCAAGAFDSYRAQHTWVCSSGSPHQDLRCRSLARRLHCRDAGNLRSQQAHLQHPTALSFDVVDMIHACGLLNGRTIFKSSKCTLSSKNISWRRVLREASKRKNLPPS